MKYFGMTLVAFFMIVTAVSAQDTLIQDEAPVREQVQQMETGWNTKSGSSFAKPFAEDADYVVINGMYIKGRTAIAAGHQEIFDTIYKDTKVTLAVKQIRFLRPDVAVVHVNAHREGPTKELTADAVLTLVMTKEKQGWSIAAFQNTQVVKRQ